MTASALHEVRTFGGLINQLASVSPTRRREFPLYCEPITTCHAFIDRLFPDGRIVLLTRLSEGQEATVLQLPAQLTTVTEAVAQKRIAYVG